MFGNQRVDGILQRGGNIGQARCVDIIGKRQLVCKIVHVIVKQYIHGRVIALGSYPFTIQCTVIQVHTGFLHELHGGHTIGQHAHAAGTVQ